MLLLLVHRYSNIYIAPVSGERQVVFKFRVGFFCNVTVDPRYTRIGGTLDSLLEVEEDFLFFLAHLLEKS